MRSDLASIGQEVDDHAISIKHLELQMANLSSTVNRCQQGTLPNSTLRNPYIDGHCMAVTTRDGKQTIDPLMPSRVENVIRGDDEVVEVSGELEKKWEKKMRYPKR